MATRVCHVSTVHSVNDVRVFHRECRSLAAAGFEVHLVVPASGVSRRDGVWIHAIPRLTIRPLRILLMPWVALASALRTRSRLYHLHDPELLPIGFVMRWVLRRRVVFDVHEAVPLQILSKEWLPRWSRSIVAGLYRAIERVLRSGLTIVVANDSTVGDYCSPVLVRNYPLLRDEFAHMSLDRWTESDPPLLVYVGGVSTNRGAEVYIELARSLRDRGQRFRMKVVGPCAAAYERRLRDRVDAAGLRDHVELIGRTDHAEAMAMVARASVGLCLLLPVPNYTACLATKILEYMMMGTPVLASRFDHWRPYVDGEGAGVTVDPCDAVAVADACERMLADRTALAAMGERGATAVRRRYHWSPEFDKLRSCYDDLLER